MFMNKTAIDVVLLPSPAMMVTAIEINMELLKTFENKIVLDTKHCLPHISVCMGVVNNDDIPKATRILGDIAHKSHSFALTAESIKVDTIPTGKSVSGLTIGNTDDLQKLHESTMQKLRSLLSYDVEASMFYNPSEVEDVTFTWPTAYGNKHDDPTSFRPHMTVGFGDTDRFAFPIDFTASTLALCQLGNYCTCRKVLAAFDLQSEALT
jgi:2'-5' RNA ligase